MASKKLDSYKSRLSSAQIAEGMNAALSNARRLAADAQLLLEAQRFPTAASVAILAIEEAGKVTILRTLALAMSDKEVADCWRDYRSHTKKNVTWLLPQLVAEGARRLEDFRPLFDTDSDHPFILDQVKQIGFYTDCLGQAHWSIPEVVVDKSLATALVQIAQIFTRDHIVTAQEIDLWIKHLAPAWTTDAAGMNQAITDWYAEMQQNGLAPDGVNKMEEFIRRGVIKG